MDDYTKTLGWLRGSSKKIGVNYEGAVILFEHVPTSGFVRLDMGLGLYIPWGQPSVFRVPVRFTLYSEKGQRNILKVLFSLSYISIIENKLQARKRVPYWSSTFGQIDYSQESNGIFRSLT